VRPAPALSRRRLLGGGLAAVAGLTALTACGGEAETNAEGSADTGVAPEDGPWSFTDGIGQDIALDARPTRIAAYGDQAAALMHFGITPVAIFHYQDPATDSTFDGLDLDGIPVVGTAYGEIDLEQLLGEIRPDLVVTTSYREETPDTMYGFKDKTQIDTIRSQVPIAGILQDGTALDVIRANEELVGLLGVDVEGGKVAEDRAAFEQVSDELREAAGTGLTAVAIYAEDANLYYAKAPDDPALAYYAELGVQFPEFAGKDYYWEIVSWERADTYSPDLFLYSERDSYTLDQYAEQPTFAALPAPRAGQMHPWVVSAMDYVSQAAYMRRLAEWLREDDDVA